MDTNKNSGSYQKNFTIGSAFERQEESFRMLMKLSESRGIKEDSGNIKKILKLAEDLRFDVESYLRILAGLQSISPDQRKRIRYLHAKELGKVAVKVPKPVLEHELVTPKPPELGFRECSEISYIDGLRDSKTGVVYFVGNHRDKQIKYILPSEYDHAMDEIREEINSFISEFLRYKNKAFDLYEAEGFSFDTRLGHECPEFRTYEFELIDVGTEEVRYKLIYGRGKLIDKKGNLPFDRFITIIKKIGRYEL